ncbi:MAG: ABC transporter ATP-binding protein [bacterium]|nr:ABC transporter ATP-binding protein [bacterium]MDD4558599.1 ABC transporter ATP-binding protein [bacterium]
MYNFLRLLRKYIRPYSDKVLAAVVLMFMHTGFAMAMPLVLKYLVDDVLYKERYHLLIWVFLVYLGLRAMNSLVAYMRGLIVVRLGQAVVYLLRRDIYAQLNRLQLSYYDRTQSGKIVSRLINDVNIIQNMVTTSFITYFTDLITLVTAIGILLSINTQLAFLAILVIPAYIINYNGFIGRVRENSHRIRRKTDEIIAYLSERISGVRVIKAFNQEKQENKRAFKKLRTYYHLNYRAAMLSSGMSIIAQILSGMSTAVVLWYGGYLVLQDRLSTGGLIAFYSLVAYLYNPAVHFSQINTVIQRMRAALDRIYELLDMYPQIADKPGSPALKAEEGHIRFENVSFRYDGTRRVLEKITLDIPSGSKVAVIGRSGSGKSTLASLIARFYDPTEGYITIDGQDIREVKIESLRKQIGIVFQESMLFSGTIRDNICYGSPRATDEEMIIATRAARIDDFVEALPDNYYSMIGERGVSLSGGQKQRIAIARALLTQPRILIFDDCTSALDAQTEAAIQETLQDIMKNRTNLVITHRLSTIIDADLIVVLDEGSIVEQGVHDALLNLGGVYASMFQQQFGLVNP